MELVMARSGRKRKLGPRYANGQLHKEHRDSPRVIAAQMPHRKGLGDHGTDQKAESELGRMALFGRISDHQFMAGQRFAAVVGAYRSTIQPPRALAGNGRGYDCRGDADCCDCECRRRKARYDGAYEALMTAGRDAVKAVNTVAIYDNRCPWQLTTQLVWGLAALVQHFGIAEKRKS